MNQEERYQAFTERFEYSKANPDSEFATRFRGAIEAGDFDTEMKQRQAEKATQPTAVETPEQQIESEQDPSKQAMMQEALARGKQEQAVMNKPTEISNQQELTRSQKALLSAKLAGERARTNAVEGDYLGAVGQSGRAALQVAGIMGAGVQETLIEPAVGATIGVGKSVAGGLEALSDPLTRLFGGDPEKAREVKAKLAPEAIKLLTNVASKTPIIGTIMSQYNSLSPEAKQDLQAAVDIIDSLSLTAGLSDIGGKKVIQEAGETVVDTAKSATKSAVTATKEIVEESAVKARKSFVDDLVVPIQNKKKATEDIASGLVEEGSLGRKRILSPSEQKTADVLMEVESVKPSNTALQNTQSVRSEISNEARNLNDLLFSSAVYVDEEKLLDKLITLKDESKIVFKSDKAIEKAYDDVIETYLEIRRKYGNGANDALEARQEFDKLMDSKFNLFSGQTLDPKNNATKNAILDVRRGVNDFIADIVPDANVRASLNKQTQLFNAKDVLAAKAYTEGSNAIARSVNKLSKLTGVDSKTLKNSGLIGLGGAVGASAVTGGAAIMPLLGIAAGATGIGVTSKAFQILIPKAKKALIEILENAEKKLSKLPNDKQEEARNAIADIRNIVDLTA